MSLENFNSSNENDERQQSNRAENNSCTVTVKEAVKKTFREYSENTAIHGIPYLGQKHRYKLERLFWLFMIIGSMYFCGGYIINIWDKWNDTPVIISFSEKSTPVWKFPLPTITICPDTKIAKDVFHYGKYVTELEEWILENRTIETRPEWLDNEEIMKYLEVGSEICDYNISDVWSFKNKFFNGRSFFEVVDEMRKPIEPNFFTVQPDDIFQDCWFNLERFECFHYFDEILTEKGICYVFNFLNASKNVYREDVLHEELIRTDEPLSRSTNWSLDKGYEEDSINETYPFRSYSPLVENGLFIRLVTSEYNIDSKCSGGSEGFKISLNAPGEIPIVSKHYINVPFNHEILIDISPEMITTQKSAMSYNPKIRHCYLEHERPLRFFKMYNRNNCELECLTNHTFALCGCVKFFMPRTADMPLCGAGTNECYEKAKDEVISRDFIRLRTKYPEKVLNCNCFPSCKTLSYSSGVTEAALRQTESENIRSVGFKTAEISIYFNQRRYWTSERSKLYGSIEFIAHVGGLMGLFMGVSVVSCVEIFYYLTLRFMQLLKIVKSEN